MRGKNYMCSENRARCRERNVGQSGSWGMQVYGVAEALPAMISHSSGTRSPPQSEGAGLVSPVKLVGLERSSFFTRGEAFLERKAGQSCCFPHELLHKWFFEDGACWHKNSHLQLPSSAFVLVPSLSLGEAVMWDEQVTFRCPCALSLPLCEAVDPEICHCSFVD